MVKEEGEWENLVETQYLVSKAFEMPFPKIVETQYLVSKASGDAASPHKKTPFPKIVETQYLVSKAPGDAASPHMESHSPSNDTLLNLGLYGLFC